MEELESRNPCGSLRRVLRSAEHKGQRLVADKPVQDGVGSGALWDAGGLSETRTPPLPIITHSENAALQKCSSFLKGHF